MNPDKRADLIRRLTDDVNDLTLPVTHDQHYAVHDGIRVQHRIHRSHHPSLLEQLRDAVEPTSMGEGHRTPASTPAASIEAIEAEQRIENAAAKWVTDVRMTLRMTTEENLRALVGATGVLDDDVIYDLARDIRRWRSIARVVTRWDSAPWRPHVPCPACDALDALRVRLGDQVACCIECGEAWDSDHIGILAEYVRDITGGEGDRGGIRTA